MNGPLEYFMQADNFLYSNVGRSLRRALDNKLRKLRSMLTADEDITTELDRVVCRLMKLALRTSKGRQNPPPTRWMQYKLLDLLTLTERAIDRRKRHFVETYSLKAINYNIENESEEIRIIPHEEIEGDDTVNKIVDKYRHLVQTTVLNKKMRDIPRTKYLYPDMELTDDLSVTSTEILKENVDTHSPSLIDPELILNENTYEFGLNDQETMKFDRVRNWIEKENIEVVSTNHSNVFDNSSGDTENSNDFNETYERSIRTYNVDDLSVYKTLKVVNYEQLEDNTKNVKCNKVKLIKKLTRKRSYCGKFVRKTKYFNQASKWRKLYSTPSKPIPGSLIELCHPELNEGKYYDDYQSPVIVDTYERNENNSEVNNISATEESYLMVIVMEDMEETIALRRTIGTDPVSEITQLECETVIQCINHETSYKVYEEHERGTENVESQTIFLNDINEPSTSKGIRHTSMDVQCGSDNTAQTYSMLSATTSYTKLDIGVKICDLYTDVKVNRTEFGTSTDNLYIQKIISPNTKSIGIRIRDSDKSIGIRIRHSDHVFHQNGAITQRVKDAESMSPVLQCLDRNEAKLPKSVSSNLKIDNSGSDFCNSIDSLLKNPLHYANLYDLNKVLINSLSKEVSVANKLSTTKFVKPMLCCGGVHIHSYKDKTISEDVVYQGDWQRYRPKSIIKKKSFNSVLNRSIHPLLKRNDVIKNKKPIIASNNRGMKYEIKKHIQSRNNVLLYKPRQSSKAVKNEKIFEINKNSELSTTTNIKKITSKHLLGTFTSKLKYAQRKPVISSSIDVKKDRNVNQQRLLLKNYIPTYLRQKQFILSTTITKNLNDSLNTVGTGGRLNKKKMINGIPPLLNSKAKEMKSDVLKFHPRTSERMNYFVFRNEINSKNSASNGESAKTEERITNNNNINNRAHSPQSQNSSCSSPNSVATIRFVSQAPKSASAKRNTASPQKNYMNDSSSEPPTSSRLKKFTKRINSCKSTKNSDIKHFDNKENISQKCNLNSKQGNKLEKNVYKSNHKSVFIAQLNTDNKSLESTLTSLSRYKAQYSEFKSSLDNNVEVRCTSGSPSGSDKRFLKSENNVDRNIDIILQNNSSNEKFELLTKTQLMRPSQEIILSKNTVENHLGYYMATNSSETENGNDNRIAMRQLLEETLSNIISCHNHVNAESERDVNADHHQNSISANFTNVFSSTLDIAMEIDLYDSLNNTIRDTSLFSLTDTNVNVTDLDLLSFKSITSGTKLSESYFDGCDFNVLTPKSNSILELFEKKDEPLIQIPGGSLAVQAFSGFSVDGEPVIGDKPNHINLVDSETGSLAFGIARQATSEELFVSGRSSDSYESCVIDEDVVVPNWLFNIISQQQSVTAESDSLSLVTPIPLEGPMPTDELPFDTNGNTVDPGAGEGAGDGRGIHSDSSQDSSGRGTSLSSSDTSSGQQSEAIIIDQTNFLEQFESINNNGTLAVPIISSEANQLPDNIIGVSEVSEQIIPSTQSSRNDPGVGLISATSDVDADISSLNTDATDSSYN